MKALLMTLRLSKPLSHDSHPDIHAHLLWHKAVPVGESAFVFLSEEEPKKICARMNRSLGEQDSMAIFTIKPPAQYFLGGESQAKLAAILEQVSED